MHLRLLVRQKQSGSLQVLTHLQAISSRTAIGAGVLASSPTSAYLKRRSGRSMTHWSLSWLILIYFNEKPKCLEIAYTIAVTRLNLLRAYLCHLFSIHACLVLVCLVVLPGSVSRWLLTLVLFHILNKVKVYSVDILTCSSFSHQQIMFNTHLCLNILLSSWTWSGVHLHLHQIKK